jgi:hypothetical protein
MPVLLDIVGGTPPAYRCGEKGCFVHKSVEGRPGALPCSMHCFSRAFQRLIRRRVRKWPARGADACGCDRLAARADDVHR